MLDEQIDSLSTRPYDASVCKLDHETLDTWTH